MKYTDPVKFIRDKFGPDSNAEHKFEEEIIYRGVKVPLDIIIKAAFNMLTVHETLETGNTEIRNLIISLWGTGYPERDDKFLLAFIQDGAIEVSSDIKWLKDYISSERSRYDSSIENIPMEKEVCYLGEKMTIKDVFKLIDYSERK